MPVGYGKRIRGAVRAARVKSTASYQCPNCSRQRVRRVSSAIWQCKKCSAKFASGMYEFRG